MAESRAKGKKRASAKKRRFEEWPLDRLRANPRNARVHPEAQLERLVESIRQFGFVAPVAARPDGELLAGHARVEAARRAGIARVPVVIVDHLSAEECRLYTIADNRIAELSAWDRDTLAAEMAELRELGLDVNASGFSDDELDQLLRRLEVAGTPARGGARGLAHELSESRACVSQLGDVWILGDHRLACGDSRSKSVWDLLLEHDEPAACVHTDPPYGVSYQAQDGGRVRNDDLRGDALADLVARAFTEVALRTRPDAAWYVWHAGGPLRDDFLFGMSAAGLVELQTIVWAKPTPTLGHADYQWAHEPCFYAARQGQRPQWHGARDQGTVWRVGSSRERGVGLVLGSGLVLSDGEGNEISINPSSAKDAKRRRVRLEPGKHAFIAIGDRASDLWEVARDRVTEHATPKPVELVAKALSNSTVAGELVLDPFAGGGSTLMGAERTGRRARAVELEPVHVDTIVRRWESTTGRQAVLAGAKSTTFAEVTAARA